MFFKKCFVTSRSKFFWTWIQLFTNISRYSNPFICVIFVVSLVTLGAWFNFCTNSEYCFSFFKFYSPRYLFSPPSMWNFLQQDLNRAESFRWLIRVNELRVSTCMDGFKITKTLLLITIRKMEILAEFSFGFLQSVPS